MAEFYGEHHRALQDMFDARRLADKLESIELRDKLVGIDRKFISRRDMFFLATVDHEGRPTVSYKGGAAGFVKVIDERSLAFPSYDGNGMFYSIGNIVGESKVGMLFIDFEVPHRLRVQGRATVSADDPMLDDYAGADLVVRVEVTEVFANCPRYVHKYRKIEDSKYVPELDTEPPLPGWKRLDTIQDVLPARDQGKAEATGGTISVEEYFEKLSKGDG
jgi:predicted pyridoxine 5'-phosphate oxidase superfamily flavin-nucleotide-binding protein